MKFKNILCSISVSTLIVFSLLACHKDTGFTFVPKVGCMDPLATNYDSTANQRGTCHYVMDTLAGRYAVVDSYFYLKQTSATSYASDTLVFHDTLTVTVIAFDSIAFDTLKRYPSPFPHHYQLNQANGTFYENRSYGYDYSEVNIIDSGQISGNKLVFKTQTIRPYYSPATSSRHLIGFKLP